MKPSSIIVGLGNPGSEYEGTRHNIGFQAVEVLAEEFGASPWKQQQKFGSEVMEAHIANVPVLLAKPMTFMNHSGEAVQKLVSFYKLNPALQLLVICDDVDLPVGEIRLREGGGAGFHNGLKSIVEKIGENFPRLRIGVLGPDAPKGSFQRAGMDLSSYVLSRPSASEQKLIDAAIVKAPEMVMVMEFLLRKK